MRIIAKAAWLVSTILAGVCLLEAQETPPPSSLETGSSLTGLAEGPRLDAIDRFAKRTDHAEHWRALREAQEDHRGALQSALSTTQSQLADTVAHSPADPWGGLDQETGFLPPIEGITFSGFESPTINEGLLQAIPTRYRLAEQLGLGANALQLELSFIDPKPKSRIPYGLEVTNRVRHALISHFTLKGHEAPIETMRYAITSVSRFGTLTFNYGPGVKPHKTGIASGNHSGAVYMRTWKKERLAERILEEGVALKPSRLAIEKQSFLESQLAEELSAALNALQTQVLDTVFASSAVVDSGKALDDAAAALTSALRDSSPRSAVPHTPCTMATLIQHFTASKNPNQIDKHALLHRQDRLAHADLIHCLSHRALEFRSDELLRACLQALTHLSKESIH